MRQTGLNLYALLANKQSSPLVVRICPDTLAIFPELPFTNKNNGVLNPNGFRSDSRSTPRRYARTDLQTLIPWASFCTGLGEVCTFPEPVPTR